MKKLLIKTIVYLFVLLLIPYLYLLWQAKKGVDSFLATQSIPGDFEYQWVWLDLEGQITLSAVRFYQNLDEPVFTADQMIITPTSIFDLVNVQEHILYREYPSVVTIRLKKAVSRQSEKLLSLFDIQYQGFMLNMIYPKECLKEINTSLPFINFELGSRFEIHQTAQESLVTFSFTSQELTNLEGSFKINGFSSNEEASSFISELSLKFSELTWLQQNTQKCLALSKSDKNRFVENINKTIARSAKENNLLVNQAAVNYLADFLYVPQSIEMNFNLQSGKTFSQIPLEPYFEYQNKTGLSILLNSQNLGTLFEAFDYISEKEKDKKQLAVEKKATQKSNFLAIIQRAIRSKLGAKVLLKMYNGKQVIGYLEVAGNDRLKIYQLKYKGKTILPFLYKNIQSIKLLREEN